MTERIQTAGLAVDADLHRFVADEILAPAGLDADTFWGSLAALVADLGPRGRALLAVRDRMQVQLDEWYREHPGQPADLEAHKAFLRDIGYLSHYVGDGSQPHHTSIHYNGWGDFPNPEGFTNSRQTHAVFEGEFTNRVARLDAVEAAMPAARIRGLSATQITPPEIAEVPPIRSQRSTSATLAPDSCAASAAVMPAAPVPRMMTSTCSIPS